MSDICIAYYSTAAKAVFKLWENEKTANQCLVVTKLSAKFYALDAVEDQQSPFAAYYDRRPWNSQC